MIGGPGFKRFTNEDDDDEYYGGQQRQQNQQQQQPQGYNSQPGYNSADYTNIDGQQQQGWNHNYNNSDGKPNQVQNYS